MALHTCPLYRQSVTHLTMWNKNTREIILRIKEQVTHLILHEHDDDDDDDEIIS
jgi:hypothetical protein